MQLFAKFNRIKFDESEARDFVSIVAEVGGEKHRGRERSRMRGKYGNKQIMSDRQIWTETEANSQKMPIFTMFQRILKRVTNNYNAIKITPVGFRCSPQP